VPPRAPGASFPIAQRQLWIYIAPGVQREVGLRCQQRARLFQYVVRESSKKRSVLAQARQDVLQTFRIDPGVNRATDKAVDLIDFCGRLRVRKAQFLKRSILHLLTPSWHGNGVVIDSAVFILVGTHHIEEIDEIDSRGA
jgi:hypothetical protein